MKPKTYISIDLKSFYASVECRERGLDPLGVNLVVADASRTEKTICLAVSPSLKAWGIPGRPRLFEVNRKLKIINSRRQRLAPGGKLTGDSYIDSELQSNPALAVNYITAVPRMGLYIAYSTKIYSIYLKYVAPEDIHIYSVDEVFIDATEYINARNISAHDFAMLLIRDVLKSTGITATAGIGTNLYLCKIAMDIVAKKMDPDSDGVRIAELDERTYREKLWEHEPITDFWRIGNGYAQKLAKNGMYTMGDVARCSLGGPKEGLNAELLYKLFGINAELLIDHAWGWEPCTVEEIKAYRPQSSSLSSGQVLKEPYDYTDARTIVSEMADSLALDLVEKRVLTDKITLTVGYDVENLKNPESAIKYKGEITVDHYGRKVPKHSHGTENLSEYTSSSREICAAALRLYDRIVGKEMLIRRITIDACEIIRESEKINYPEQLSLFSDPEDENSGIKKEAAMKRERNLQAAIIGLRERYGKNAVLKGMNFKKGATAQERNQQIGGHRA